jgi:hypothetical protein
MVQLYFIAEIVSGHTLLLRFFFKFLPGPAGIVNLKSDADSARTRDDVAVTQPWPVVTAVCSASSFMKLLPLRQLSRCDPGGLRSQAWGAAGG